MSFFTNLAGKAEELLNRVDQSAATALNTSGTEDSADQADWKPTHQAADPMIKAVYTPYLSQHAAAKLEHNAMITSASVPSNLNKLNADKGYLSQVSKAANTNSKQMTRPANTNKPPASSCMTTARLSPKTVAKRDMDDELFEFLNSPDNGGPDSKKHDRLAKTIANGKHSRQSSTSSIGSHRSVPKTPEAHSAGGRGTPISSTTQGKYTLL